MKKYRYMIGIVSVVLFVGGGFFFMWRYRASSQQTVRTSASLDGKTISMGEDGFEPDSLTVSVGTTIKFVNDDTYWHWPASDPHPSHTFYSELDPKQPIKPGTNWEVTLTKSGKWGIHDHLAPYVIGTITVTP